MPNLINTDSAGNTFYNYITPVLKGETGLCATRNWGGFLDSAGYAKFGFNFGYYIGSGGQLTGTAYEIRFPASSLESKSGTISSSPSGSSRVKWIPWFSNAWSGEKGVVYTGNSNTTTSILQLQTGNDDANRNSIGLHFAVANQFAIIRATFVDSGLTTLHSFNYIGYLREPVYDTASLAPRGLVEISKSAARRITTENGTSTTAQSTAANSITSPPIVCTPGTDPGDGSETFTDVVIRDAAAPNNPVGKLWNCIDMPASCNVGELWRNTGAYDGDGVASDQDVYLCVMPWGTRKLGMRVWTENVF